MTRDELIEKMARAICSESGDDPERLEPGNVFPLPWMNKEDFYDCKYDDDPRMTTDGMLRGDVACFVWRDYIWKAKAALTAIEAAGLCIVPRQMPYMPESKGWEGDQGQTYSEIWYTLIGAGRI